MVTNSFSRKRHIELNCIGATCPVFWSIWIWCMVGCVWLTFFITAAFSPGRCRCRFRLAFGIRRTSGSWFAVATDRTGRHLVHPRHLVTPWISRILRQLIAPRYLVTTRQLVSTWHLLRLHSVCVGIHLVYQIGHAGWPHCLIWGSCRWLLSVEVWIWCVICIVNAVWRGWSIVWCTHTWVWWQIWYAVWHVLRHRWRLAAGRCRWAQIWNCIASWIQLSPLLIGLCSHIDDTGIIGEHCWIWGKRPVEYFSVYFRIDGIGCRTAWFSSWHVSRIGWSLICHSICQQIVQICVVFIHSAWWRYSIEMKGKPWDGQPLNIAHSNQILTVRRVFSVYSESKKRQTNMLYITIPYWWWWW